jgi:uncharacterized protein (DUF2062 family)
MRGVALRLRRIFYGLRTEGAGPGRETAAVAVGVFIGCLPLYGLHLLLCWGTASILRLNRLKVYLAANISNPLIAPWLIVAEVEVGAWLRRGAFHELTPHAIRSTALGVFASDLLIGGPAVAAFLAIVSAVATHATRGGSADDGFRELVRRAADRYVSTSVTAWEFARGKLRHDPVYRATLSADVLTSGRTLLDVGCGQGLALALLAEAGRAVDSHDWPPGWPAPPRFERMVGIETRHRVAVLARTALDGDADIIEADARGASFDQASAILLIDVLQLMRRDEQEALLTALAARLEPGGVMLVRESDASAGWRYTTVWLANRVKALAFGRWKQPFHSRTEAEWRDCFRRHGFRTEVHPMSEGTPFANLLFRLRAEPHESVPTRPFSPPDSARDRPARRSHQTTSCS